MRFEAYRWLLIPVIAIHNLEEWATLPTLGSMAPALSTRTVIRFAETPWRVMEVGWVLATLLPAAVVFAASRARQHRSLDILVCWVAALYLANVLLPHAIELALGGGYAPGLATAFLVNLPFCSLLLRQAVRENIVTGRELAAIVAVGFVSLVPVLVAVLWLASAVTQAFGPVPVVR
ncbi:MAG: HXXEE domain-containing protein [Candidatus Eremiobacteraeota bacterium]|nr:HXXEE domain-containing protein [Candidatus Eremiobacteraeota bacterium]